MKAVVAIAVSALLLSWPAGLAAQQPAPDPHTVQPQRPTVATHAGTVAPGWIEIEAGTEFDRYDDTSNGALAPILAKIGLARRLQLEVQTILVSPAGGETSGVGDSTIGVKWRLAEDVSIAGDVAILASVKLPSGSVERGAGTGTADLNLLFISSHKLGPVAMDLNVGYTRRRGDGSVAPISASVWTASFGGPARGRLGWVAELYGYPRTSGPAGADSIVAFLAGPTFAVRNWLVLDVGGIVAIAGPQPRALFAGITCNVGQLWK